MKIGPKIGRKYAVFLRILIRFVVHFDKQLNNVNIIQHRLVL